MNTDQAAAQAQQQQPPQQRMPQINPKAYAAFNTIDSALSKSPLTRLEHEQATGTLQALVQGWETMEGQIKEAAKQVDAKDALIAELQTKIEASKEVGEAIEKVAFDTKPSRKN